MRGNRVFLRPRKLNLAPQAGKSAGDPEAPLHLIRAGTRSLYPVVSGQNFVFLDPGGRRWVWIRAMVGLCFLAAELVADLHPRALGEAGNPNARFSQGYESPVASGGNVGQLRRRLQKTLVEIFPSSSSEEESRRARPETAQDLGGRSAWGRRSRLAIPRPARFAANPRLRRHADGQRSAGANHR